MRGRSVLIAGVAFFWALTFWAPMSTLQAAEARDWTDSAGNKVKAEYLKSTEDFVTVRTENLKTMVVPLEKLSEADRAFVAAEREKEKEANTAESKIRGEIVWRLDNQYRMMSLMTSQSAEIWTWDEKEKKPAELVTKVQLKYGFNMNHARNDIAGDFETEGAVKFPKDAKLVVIATLQLQKDGKPVAAKDTSVPMTVPKEANGVVKLPTVRASAR